MTVPPSVPFPEDRHRQINRRTRRVLDAPLIVRRVSTDAATNPYTKSGRSRLLNSLGVPDHFHDSKVLVVSFGGQIVPKPASRSSRTSRSASPTPSGRSIQLTSIATKNDDPMLEHSIPHGDDHSNIPSRMITPSHMFVPGAPPTSKPTSPLTACRSDSSMIVTPSVSANGPWNDSITISPATPIFNVTSIPSLDSFIVPQLLPDNSWIAIVCGVSKEKWNALQDNDDDNNAMPENFFVAPKDVNMVDLTAVGEVLLGKLVILTFECLLVCYSDHYHCTGIRYSVGMFGWVYAFCIW